MSWVGVITSAGKTLFDNYIASGTAINIDTVKTGTGTVSTENMRSATNLQSQVTTGAVVEKKVIDAGVVIKMNIGPYSSSYTMKEVGLFATSTSGGITSTTMVALFQNTDGVIIPDVSEFPDYSLVLSAVLDIDNDDTLTIDVPTAAYVSHAELSSALNSMDEAKLDVDQGSENAGKFVVVGDDGELTLVSVPSAGGSSF